MTTQEALFRVSLARRKAKLDKEREAIQNAQEDAMWNLVDLGGDDW